MVADEGVGYLAPVTYQCLYRPAIEHIRAAHSTSVEAAEAVNVSQKFEYLA